MKFFSIVAAGLAVAGCTAENKGAATASSTNSTVINLPASNDTTRVNDSIATSIRGTVKAVAPTTVPWPSGKFDTVYNMPLDSKYTLLATRTQDDVSHRVTLRLQLVSTDTTERVRDIATLIDGDIAHNVIRADSEAIVISRHDSHGLAEASSKLFLDPASRSLIKQFDFPAAAGLAAIPDAEVATVLGLPDSVVRALKRLDPRPAPGEPSDIRLPAAMKLHPLPSGTESIGPFQVDGQRTWFAKTFYSGEGESGVGGAGVFDATTSKYTFLKIPELAPWSASALLFDDQTLWIGMVEHPEGGDYSGGLLRHDLKTDSTKVYPVPDVISRIKRWNGRTYAATTGGVVVIDDDRPNAHYMVEPDSSGKLVLVRRGQPATFSTIYEKPIDQKYLLSIATLWQDSPQFNQLRIRLIDRSERDYWDLATFSERSISLWWKVLRADAQSAVLSRDGDYGVDHKVKVFFDTASKKVLKRVDYSAHIGIDSVAVASVSDGLAVSPSFAQELMKMPPRAASIFDGDSLLPPEVRGHRMPSSTYDDFARARPKRVEDGYDRKGTDVGEAFGPYQRVGSRIWFGKTFYDGEGTTGVGGFGYFDTPTSTYKFLPIKEMAPWSVSALLVEDRFAWIGLVGHPEGADYSGGLLQYDLKTGSVKKYPVEEVVLRILRQGPRVYLVTQSGVSIIEQDRLVARYVVEPARDGGYTIIRS